ncbi:MAG: hypothetical protein HY017_07140 [Betaproteobacteria bacterium]|nr:hypothetical protein [Betaproteobacteria bacterium]
MAPSTPFSNLVVSEFGFLVSDYGFERVDHPDYPAGQFLEYRREPITIGFGWYKGEINVDFSVSLEFSAEHKVFRPYLSRTFSLSEIALRQDRDAFASWAARPGAGEFITSLAKAKPYLAECARIMKQYCVSILRGDLTMLEHITAERRG